ncbi:MAG: phage DNA encapsidation protein [Methanobrevibacter sp.]|nr:phage DNA encapsidation protein [Methanobrevibacter sp.]
MDKTAYIEESIQSKSDSEYYNIANIDKLDCHYNVIFGKRSNGKTYSALQKIIKNYAKKGEQGAYLRRYREDFKGKRGATLFDSLIANGEISKATGGKWDTVSFYSDRWYLARKDEETDRIVKDSVPFCFGFSLAQMEHDKSTSYPMITTVVFDEFMSRIGYLPNEFVLFMNVLSTIIRQRNNVKIYMLANTVNKYCPYFNEMGLKHILEMEPGNIDIYTYGESSLRVACEYTQNHNIEGRKSDVYFAFDNPNLQMITGGAWELDLYPHLPREYDTKDIVFKYFVCFNDNILQCEVIELRDCRFTYVHRKTGDIRHPEKDVVFSPEYDPRPNHIRNIRKSGNKLCRRIYNFYREDRVFYQDNDVGEIIRNYMMFCQKEA